ncbi:MAG: ABC transporter permease [Chloroflexota bacterium]
MTDRVNGSTRSTLGVSLPPGSTIEAPPSSIRRAMESYALPGLVILAFLAMWQFLPPALNIPAYELPNLSRTMTGMQQNWSQIGTALMITLQDALLGFLIGNGLAILGATIFAYSPLMERAFYPLAILVQTIPIIVYAPLFVIVFYKTPVMNGAPEAAAVVGVAVLITFFPTLVNMTVGFKAIDPRILELMRLLNASKTQIFVKLRFPSAMPFLFSSLKITSTLSFVGAIVGEYMAGGGANPLGHALSASGVPTLLGFDTNPTNGAGVGYQLQTFIFRLDKPGMFADVLAISLMSIVFFAATVIAEQIFVPWRKPE